MYEQESHRKPSYGSDVIAMDIMMQKTGGELSTETTQAVAQAKSNGECAEYQAEIIKSHDKLESIDVKRTTREKPGTHVRRKYTLSRETFWYLLQLNNDFLFKIKLIGSCVAGAFDV